MEIYSFNEIKNIKCRKIGIYCIFYSVGDKKYVGKTNHAKGFAGRFSDHRELLRAGIHDNIYLQRSYNKYGENKFFFKILEVCEDPSVLSDREKFWMENLESMYFQKGWNLQTVGDEVKRKTFSPRRDKKWLLISPSGEKVLVKSQKEFSEKYNLDTGNVCRLLNGKMKFFKGWRLENNHPKEKHVFIFENLNGEKVECCSPEELSEKTKLGRSSFYILSKNADKMISGWRCLNTRTRESTNKIINSIISPNNKVITFSNTSSLVRKFGISYSNINPVIKGTIRASKGWKNIDRCIVIRNLINGELKCFSSQKEMRQYMKIHPKTLKKLLNGTTVSSRFKIETINSLETESLINL